MEPDASSLLQVNTQTIGARSKLTTYVKHQVHFDRQTAEFVGLHAASSNSTDCSPSRSALQMRENEGLQCQRSYLTVCPYAGSARLPEKYTSLSQKPSRAAAPNHRIGPDSESGLNHGRIDVVQAAILADQQINTNRSTRIELKDQ